jgi:hypothetical protein
MRSRTVINNFVSAAPGLGATHEPRKPSNSHRQLRGVTTTAMKRKLRPTPAASRTAHLAIGKSRVRITSDRHEVVS